ncbi:hypothetical protein AiwAL_17835 [Acidiphilium sp. AL]|uniref:Transcriptional regulator n=1 Tax=Acidiphilium iwatense TaxID=768198 RepID=A0ABS9E1G5_9PROT|nr:MULTISPECIES: hypothetical protein [Acidiphilium]MCF3948856.1 hypothetical protein [Acidiphilium iwatense]MCU4161930.1 hypothetical protein [Acidiphilium sp. AL]
MVETLEMRRLSDPFDSAMRDSRMIRHRLEQGEFDTEETGMTVRTALAMSNFSCAQIAEA